MSVLLSSYTSSTTKNNNHDYLSKLSKTSNVIIQPNGNSTEHTANDHVPYGVVNSMRKRFLDKINESLLVNNVSIFQRHSLSKSSGRVSSNENLLQTKVSTPLNQTTRLSRSQDSLLNNNNINHQNDNAEQFTSYLKPKQDVIIVDKTIINDEISSTQRHVYSELHVDEVPKPGTVTNVKKMFERQIRLTRYDSERSPNTPTSSNSRVINLNRDISSPSRSRSMSPNDMALRQRRTITSLPLPTQYPDLVISHTPTATSTNNETGKVQNITFNHIPNEIPNDMNQKLSNQLSTSSSSSDTVDYASLDFKSRLALFNRTNTIEQSNENSYNSINIKKSLSLPATANFLTKPVLHHHSDKQDNSSEHPSRSLINVTKPVTFFGGTKSNGNTKSTLPPSIPVPIANIKDLQSSKTDLFRPPDVIGGNVKLNKSSISSGMKKDVRVQFIDNVHTYEYPSYHVIMAEYPHVDSDNEGDAHDNKNVNGDKCIENIFDDEPMSEENYDVDDDELEQLARINAQFNSNNSTNNLSNPKGSFHTFRPTHLDQYELGKVNDSLSYLSDMNLWKNYLNSPSNNSILKPDKSTFDMTRNIQWSSMSTTTDLLF